jgi:hypothetical protein
MKNYKSLTDALQDLKSRGYEANFDTESFCLYCGDLDIRLDPEEFRVDEEYRFEADPNHEEDTVLVAITSLSGVKGTLVDSYAAYSEKLGRNKANELSPSHQTISMITSQH